jgi:hypothetical protein
MTDRIETFVGTRLLHTDDGENKPMGLTVVDGQMKLIFAGPTAWIGINRLTARALAERLLKFADTGA